MEFDDAQGDRYRDIIEYLAPPDGEPTSSAALNKALDWDSEEIQNAVQDLVAFGELELINAPQYARVRLREQSVNEAGQAGYAPPDEPLASVWHAYITEQSGTGRTRARRLYNDRAEAEAHLQQIANVEALTPVPGVEDVWCATTMGAEAYKQEYAVVRREPIFREPDHPYP